jgi:hypothetical protein
MPISVNNKAPNVDLGKVVRPFLPSTGKPDRLRVNFAGGVNTNGSTTTTEGESVPTLEFECSAKVEVTTLPGLSVTQDVGDDKDVVQNETDRKTRIQRVYQNDDPESGNYVDFEVYDEISFTNESKKTRNFKLNNP